VVATESQPSARRRFPFRTSALSLPPSLPPCRAIVPRNSLINNEDKEYFKRMLVELANKHGLGSSTYDELFGPGRYVMFGDWIKVRPHPCLCACAPVWCPSEAFLVCRPCAAASRGRWLLPGTGLHTRVCRCHWF
jgi:hypothetical protein